MSEASAPTTLNTTGGVGSRFVSETDLDAAKRRKEEEWKAAYARLGQEPPPKLEDGEYDPRSLFEKLDAQKQAKREQWDEKMKLSNQFRGLEADELQFLDEVAQEQRAAERAQKEKDEEQMRAFKAMQNRQGQPIPSPPITTPSSSSTSAIPSQPAPTKPPQRTTAKNTVKSLLKGVKVVVKPKTKTSSSPNPSGTVVSALGGSASHANGSASPLASGLGSSKLQVDRSMYSQTPSPAGPSSSTAAATATATAKPAPTQKRKIQALGADYGSDDDSDEEEEKAATKKSVVDDTEAAGETADVDKDEMVNKRQKVADR